MPTVQLPSVQMPTVQIPSVQMPTVQLPSIQMPSIQVPSIPKSPTQMPTVQMPTVQLPSVPKSPTQHFPTISEDVLETSKSQNAKVEQREIEVVPYGNGLYRDVNTGFILAQDGLIYLDVDETEKYLQRKITQEDRVQALNLGLQIRQLKPNFIPSIPKNGILK